MTTVGDVLAIVQLVRNAGGPYESIEDDEKPYPDVNADGKVNIQDMLEVITYLRNNQGGADGEGEAEDSAGTSQQVVGLFVTEQPDDATREAAVADAGPGADAIDDLAADVAAASPSSDADRIDLSDDSDEIDDAIDAIIGDLVG